MKRMARSNVFLSGLGGLGIEIGLQNFVYRCLYYYLYYTAKNIVLAGVKVWVYHL